MSNDGWHDQEQACLANNFRLISGSMKPHPFTFMPAISLFIECGTNKEIEHLYHAFSTNGQALMPLYNYGLSPAFGRVDDRFGVPCQLNLVTKI